MSVPQRARFVQEAHGTESPRQNPSKVCRIAIKLADMDDISQQFSSSTLRQHTRRILDAALREPTVITQYGQPTFVIMAHVDYHELLRYATLGRQMERAA